MKKEKLLHIEFLRVLAILCVIFNHTVTDGFLLFTTRPAGSFSYWIYLVLSVGCKFAVPVYFMISGALLLNRPQEPLKVLWQKRIWRMVVVLVVISLVYFLIAARHGGVVAFSDFLQQLYSTGAKGHLWFMYSYIGFLIALPFLRALVQGLSDKYFYYLLALVVGFNVLQFVSTAFGWVGMNDGIKPAWLFGNVVLYPCLGYFLEHRLRVYSMKQLVIIWAINLVAIMLTCALTRRDGVDQNYHGMFVTINAVTVYLSAKMLFLRYWRPKKRMAQFICSLGGCAFGIYLIHLIPMSSRLTRIVLDGMTSVGVNQMIACWLWCFLVFAMCYVVIWLARKIPLVKKFI